MFFCIVCSCLLQPVPNIQPTFLCKATFLGKAPVKTCKGHTQRRYIQDKHYTVRLEDTILFLPRTEQIFEELSKHPAIDYDLPRKNSLSGKVLKHVYQVLDTYKERTWPMTYKVGFTHSPLFRWGNSLYGYQKEKVSWDGMMVVFCSQDPLAAAYVEAALIQRHIGDSPE